MDALADVGKFVGKEIGSDALVERLPRLAVVVGAKAAGGGDGGVDSLGVPRVSENRVHRQPARARVPAVARGVLSKAFHLEPIFSAVVGAEERARIDAAPERFGTRGSVRGDLPDAVEI